jgi:hypothetical protein
VEPFELLGIVARVCESLGIRYVTVGSLATIAFGEPRYTNDIDIVLDLRSEQVSDFCQALPVSSKYPASISTARTSPRTPNSSG